MAKPRNRQHQNVFKEMAAAVPLRYGRDVEVYAAARGGKHGLERRLRSEIAALFGNGLPSAESLLVHVVSWHGTNDVLLRGWTTGMRVDLCKFERIGERPISIPISASDEI